LGILREAGGLLVVLDGFSRSDLAEQFARFRQEVFFADLDIISNRLEKLHDQIKKPRPGKDRDKDIAEQALLKRIYTAFEAEQHPGTLGLRPDEEKLIRSFQLLTLKPELVLVNAGEAQLAQPLPGLLQGLTPPALKAAVSLEMELADLGDE